MLTELAKKYIGPALSSVGFRKKGTTWNRSINEVVQVLDLQKGRKRPDGSIDFTLNVGLWLEQVWCPCWGKPAPIFVKEEDCFPRFRIGFLLEEFNPRFRDKWWVVTEEGGLEKVGAELREVVEEKCLAFFGAHTSLSQIVPFAEEVLPIRLPLDKLYFGILEFLHGNRDVAQRTLSELESDPHWGQRTREASSRLHRSGCPPHRINPGDISSSTRSRSDDFDDSD